MKNSYLALAHAGKNDWWRYWWGMLLILVIWIYGGGLFALGFVKLAFQSIETANPLALYTTEKIQDLFTVLAVFLTLKWLHGREVSTLFSVEGRLNLKRFCLSTVVWLLLTLLPVLGIWLFDPSKYASDFNLRQLFILLLVIVMTAFQSAEEELVFRGYLLQGINSFTSQPFIAVCLSSLVFAYGHFLNLLYIPLEDLSSFAWYFVFGVFASILTLRDNRIELAMGVHTATNLSFFLLVKSADSPFTTAIIKQTSDSQGISEAWFVAMMAIFYSIFFLVPRKSNLRGLND